MDQKKVRLFEKKQKPSHVDPFLINNDPSCYVEAFKDLPKTDTLENAKEAVHKLRLLQKKFSQDEGGSRHVRLIAEIGEHQALLKGKPSIFALYTSFLKELDSSSKKKKKEKKKVS